MKLPTVDAHFVLSTDGKVMALPRGTAGHPAADPARFDAVIEGRAPHARTSPARTGARRLRRVLGTLRRDLGVVRLLCDSDPPLFRELAAGGFVTRLHLTVLPCIAGGAKADTLTGPPATALLARSIPLRLESVKVSRGQTHATYAFPRGA
jgi:riboflavin biosynthesis pyrimidine reductase